MNHTVHCQCTPQDVANDIHIFSSVGRAISECVAGLLRASVGPYPECDSHLYLQPMLAAHLLGDSQFECCFAKKSHASCFHPGVFTVNKNRDLTLFYLKNMQIELFFHQQPSLTGQGSLRGNTWSISGIPACLVLVYFPEAGTLLVLNQLCITTV